MKNTARNKTFIVYEHINKTNGKRYIGITSKDAVKRWGMNGSQYRSNKHFYNAIQKYGWDGFEHNILFDGLTMEDASLKEIELISLYNSSNPSYGYNHTLGGEVGQEFSEESRKKMSESAKGKVITKEWRENISKSLKGHNTPYKGRPLSEEHKEKLRKANIGKKHSELSIEKMRNNSSHNIKIVLDGIIFDSIVRCEEYAPEYGRQIEAWLRGENTMPKEVVDRGLTYYNVKHEYIVDNVKYCKKLFCDGIIFDSMLAFDRYYNLPRCTVSSWMNGKRKIPKRFQDMGLKFVDTNRYRYVILDGDKS